MDDIELVYDPLPDPALTAFITDNLVGFVIAKTGVSDWQPVNLFLKNPRGEWVGGLLGQIWGGWLHVKILWVSGPYRGKGLGTRLLMAAESMARENGAFAATLDTHSFQAPDFYPRFGYQEFGRLEDYPPGHTKIFFAKRLVD
jgi:GNAT superfamily N-acetyltransferase